MAGHKMGMAWMLDGDVSTPWRGGGGGGAQTTHRPSALVAQSSWPGVHGQWDILSARLRSTFFPVSYSSWGSGCHVQECVYVGERFLAVLK